MSKISNELGKAGESRARSVLASRGVRMPERIGSKTRLVPVGIVKNRPAFHVYPGEKVSGDINGILETGIRVLAEVKTIFGRNLRWSDLDSHQPEMLRLNQDYNGISLLVWVTESGVYVMNWQFPDDGFRPGKGMNEIRAAALDVMDVNSLAHARCEHQMDSVYCCIHCGRMKHEIEELGQKYKR